MKRKIFISILCLAFATLLGSFMYLSFARHSVVYILNGGTLGENDTLIDSVTWFDDVELPTVSKEHYIFKGWSNGYKIISSINHATCDVNLSATFSPEVYSITFMDGDAEISKSNYHFGNAISDLSIFAKANATSHPYEDFVCWKDADGNVVDSISDTDCGDETLTASYAGKTYNITYDLDGGDVEGLPETYVFGTGVSFFSNPSKLGFEFDGWYSDEACTQLLTNIPSDFFGDIHLYAKYHSIQSSSSSSANTVSSNSYNSSSATSYDASSGMTIPRIGYHVDNVVIDGGQEAVDAINTGNLVYRCAYSSWFTPSGNRATIEEMNATGFSSEDFKANGWYLKEFGPYYYYTDHASQGLVHLGDILVAGDICYLNGVTYTYSGIWDDDFAFPNMPEGTRLVIQTCKDSGGNYLCYFY